MDMSREWTQRDYQKLWFTGNLKEKRPGRGADQPPLPSAEVENE
jgi:hypothetical protein